MVHYRTKLVFAHPQNSVPYPILSLNSNNVVANAVVGVNGT